MDGHKPSLPPIIFLIGRAGYKLKSSLSSSSSSPLFTVRPTPCGSNIHPLNPVVPFGGSVTLNCTSSCANSTHLKWESSYPGDIQQGDGWTSVSFVNITDWKFQPLCFEDPAKEPIKVLVYLYQFSPPEIYLASSVVAGHSHVIVCNVSSLKVGDKTPHNVSLSLSSGGKTLNSSQNSSSVEYASVAQFEQDGAQIFCVAQLEVGKEVLEKTANSTLKVYAGPHNVSVMSSVGTYQAGLNITVMCHADGNPFPEFEWQLPSTDNVEFSDSNRRVTIRSAQSSHNGTYRCRAQNAYGNRWADVDILYEGTSRNWVTTVVVVVVVLVLALSVGICYICRK
ncbi:UNVERIFIED_CONTAM: hypothetical protein K2H54_051823 [Gekko kuhli]